MKTNQMRHLLPLAAIALIAMACDPFPAKPGGDPRVVRVTAHDANWTGNTVTVENTGASAGTVVNAGAYPLDAIYIQFNKPMNGLTLQKYPDYDSVGNPTVVPAVDAATDTCTRPANLTSSFPADSTFCYDGSSVTDGGQLVVTPAVALVVGTVYTVTGTVQDYEGKSLPINITVTVDPLPTATAVDGLAHPGYGVSFAYGLMVDWFPNGATSYSIQSSTDNGTTWSATIPVATSSCGTARNFNTASGTPIGYDVCEVRFPELPASTDYLFRVGDGATPSVWRETGASTRGPLPVTLTNFAATGSPTLVPGAVQLAWGRVLPTAAWAGTSGVVQPAWIVERAPDNAGVAGTFADITASLTTTAGAVRAVTSTSRSAVDLTATPGSTYWYRVRPNYTSAIVYDGAEARKVAYIAPP